MIKEMNEERQRCGSPLFIEDERLTKACQEKLKNYSSTEMTHFPKDGKGITYWVQLFGFPGDFLKGTCSEGLMMGSVEPAGLKSNERGDTNHYIDGLITHHNDMINPRWNRVGYAGGPAKDGRPCSVTLYAYLEIDEGDVEFEYESY